ncbi:hypothetical protein [Pseudodesulfovibrio tunisiensis]|uniref:hypothetical protein n=1 Tax=Pseudodesulfovibrio tunisiensis TaxID=463192 RepID=UPI001FB45531|nr:hypothetical protein [Pseudodesulfovibrio tunisiensis]
MKSVIHAMAASACSAEPVTVSRLIDNVSNSEAVPVKPLINPAAPENRLMTPRIAP